MNVGSVLRPVKMGGRRAPDASPGRSWRTQRSVLSPGTAQGLAFYLHDQARKRRPGRGRRRPPRDRRRRPDRIDPPSFARRSRHGGPQALQRAGSGESVAGGFAFSDGPAHATGRAARGATGRGGPRPWPRSRQRTWGPLAPPSSFSSARTRNRSALSRIGGPRSRCGPAAK